jgi:DNA-binding NtrC family response regulator
MFDPDSTGRQASDDDVASLIEAFGLRQLIGRSHRFLAEVRKIPIAAKCDAGVLIAGATGTGKELFARAIHYLSPRAGKPFTPVNCGAIPSELVENELFGHAAGAYTGAHAAGTGVIAESEGGTLFLDEVDCLPLLAQVKLLRFVQHKEFRPLGSARTQNANVRIIAASNANLDEAIAQRRLRQDLYYRLNVLPFHLPSLRERPSDIPLLVDHFLQKYAAEFDSPVPELKPNTMASLLHHDWPGNIRELEHVIERMVLFAGEPDTWPAGLPLSGQTLSLPVSFREAKAEVVSRFERNYIRELLQTYSGNITRAAQAARKNRRAFFQLMRKHGLSRTNAGSI